MRVDVEQVVPQLNIVFGDERAGKIKTVASAVYILFISLQLLQYLCVVPHIIGNITYVALGSFSLLYALHVNGIKKQTTFLFWVMIYTYFWLICFLFNGNADVQEILWPLAFMSIGLLLLNVSISPKVAAIAFYATHGLLFILILVNGGIGELNTAASRNAVGVMALLVLCVYATTCYRNAVNITIVPFLAGLILSIMAVGRSGILTFLLLTVLYVGHKMIQRDQIVIKVVKTALLVIGVVIIITVAYGFLDAFFEDAIRNFQRRGLESPRLIMWYDYFAKVISSPLYILLGAPIEGTLHLDTFSHNLHNSFLMLHAKYGIVILAIVIYYIFKALLYYIESRNYLFIILLIGVLFRMNFDYSNFNGSLDVALTFLLLFPFYERKEKLLLRRSNIIKNFEAT